MTRAQYLATAIGLWLIILTLGIEAGTSGIAKIIIGAGFGIITGANFLRSKP